MTLYMIGLGLATPMDISARALEIVKRAHSVYLEHYTSILQCSTDDIQEVYNRPIVLADRELVEKQVDEMLDLARDKEVCFLVVGDVFSATTHTDLYTRAKELKVEMKVIHNASVLSAIGATGLQVYKFGKVTSIPFGHEKVKTPYRYLAQNATIGAHTLFLLDLDPPANKYLSIGEAIEYLFRVESEEHEGLLSPETMGVGCARLGADTQIIKYAPLKELAEFDFGNAPYCLIIPGKMHFMEEEFLDAL
jgi:diphthine methyl ester synthase